MSKSFRNSKVCWLLLLPFSNFLLFPKNDMAFFRFVLLAVLKIYTMKFSILIIFFFFTITHL